MWHRVLQRQIDKYIEIEHIQKYTAEYESFFRAVSDTYTHFDEDRELLLRSLDLSSKEFVELNKQLRLENQIIEQKVSDRTQELFFEQTKLAQVAEHMTTGAILFDAKGIVTFVNKTAKVLLGAEKEAEVVDKLIHFFDTVEVQAHLTSALQGTSTTIKEVESHENIYSISFDSLMSESQTFGALIWIRNITEPKLLERSKNQFISIASHEMRTPLAIIRGNAELLLSDSSITEHPDIRDQVTSILKGSVRLLGIVNDFLDVQHLESGKLSLKIEQIDIQKHIEETMRDMQKLAEEKGVELKLLSDGGSTNAQIDRYRFQQICINIISNAIHYTEKGSVTVDIHTEGDNMCIRFTDTGIGMSPEDQARLFQKFQTGSAFLQSREYGSGLGLYISSMLAKAMGLTLSLGSSKIGVGTTFVLVIPTTPSIPEKTIVT